VVLERFIAFTALTQSLYETYAPFIHSSHCYHAFCIRARRSQSFHNGNRFRRPTRRLFLQQRRPEYWDLLFGNRLGPDVTGLSVSRFGGYDNSGFPPHSGDVAIFDVADATIDISFGSPVDSFGIWYTTFDPLTLQAFDVSDDLLGTVVGDPNTDGTTGTSSFLSFTNPGIQSVTLTSTPGEFVLDDLTIETGTTSAVPEPGWCALFSTTLAFFFGRKLLRIKLRAPSGRLDFTE